jgi:hypothetical protein
LHVLMGKKKDVMENTVTRLVKRLYE